MSNNFLLRKKGYFAIDENERLDIILSINGVDRAEIWDNDFVDDAIRKIKPNVFANGGDRSFIENLAKCELEACYENDVVVALGVGGYAKTNSSSSIMRKIYENRIINTGP